MVVGSREFPGVRMSSRNGGSRDGRAGSAGVSLSECLQELTPEQVVFIDRALAEIGAFGQIRIVKKKGRVRFIETLESRDWLKIARGNGKGR
jgi:hypothetical protein